VIESGDTLSFPIDIQEQPMQFLRSLGLTGLGAVLAGALTSFVPVSAATVEKPPSGNPAVGNATVKPILPGPSTGVEITPSQLTVGQKVTLKISGEGVCAPVIDFGDGSNKHTWATPLPHPISIEHTYSRAGSFVAYINGCSRNFQVPVVVTYSEKGLSPVTKAPTPTVRKINEAASSPRSVK
jgi:hypothetical protein